LSWFPNKGFETSARHTEGAGHLALVANSVKESLSVQVLLRDPLNPAFSADLTNKLVQNLRKGEEP
jgi:hypothetical protein